MCQLDLLSHKYYKILHVETRGITKALIAVQKSITPKLALIVLAALAEKILKMVVHQSYSQGTKVILQHQTSIDFNVFHVLTIIMN